MAFLRNASRLEVYRGLYTVQARHHVALPFAAARHYASLNSGIARGLRASGPEQGFWQGRKSERRAEGSTEAYQSNYPSRPEKRTREAARSNYEDRGGSPRDAYSSGSRQDSPRDSGRFESKSYSNDRNDRPRESRRSEVRPYENSKPRYDSHKPVSRDAGERSFTPNRSRDLSSADYGRSRTSRFSAQKDDITDILPPNSGFDNNSRSRFDTTTAPRRSSRDYKPGSISARGDRREYKPESPRARNLDESTHSKRSEESTYARRSEENTYPQRSEASAYPSDRSSRQRSSEDATYSSNDRPSRPRRIEDIAYVNDRPTRPRRSEDNTYASDGPRDSRRLEDSGYTNDRSRRSSSKGPEARDASFAVPYTTAASEWIGGTRSIMSVFAAKQRKVYKLHLDYESLSQTRLSLEKLAAAAGCEVVSADKTYLNKLQQAVGLGSSLTDGAILECSPQRQPPINALGAVNDSELYFEVSPTTQTKEEAAINGIVDRLSFAKHEWRRPLIIWLHGVTNIENMGGIFRTARFLGADAVLTSQRGTGSNSGGLMRASAGAIETTSKLQVRDASQFVTQSQANGWKFIATVTPSSTHKSVDIAEMPENPLAKDPCVLMVGNERDGLEDWLIKRADRRLYINGVVRRSSEKDTGELDSLNVSAATAILCDRLLQKPKGVETARPAVPDEERLF